MSISAQYDSTQVEDKWYQYWLDNQFFHATPKTGKEAYTIVIPFIFNLCRVVLCRNAHAWSLF
ncbi:MAG: hypothetical protein AAFY41_12565, partial [Bacteroidota bacterium]